MAEFTPPENEFAIREDRARRINGRRQRSTSTSETGTGTGRAGGATLDDILAELKKSNATNKTPTAEDKRNSEGDRQRKAAEKAEDEKRKKSWFSRFASTKTTGKRTGGRGKHDWSLDVDPKMDTTGAAIKRGIGATLATTLLGPAAPLVMTSVGLYKEFKQFFKWDKKATEDKKKKDKADKAKDEDTEETRARETKEANKKLRKEISETKKLLGKKLDGIKSSSLGLMGKLGGIGKLFGTKLKGLGAAFAVGFGKIKGLLGKGVKAGGRILGRGAGLLGRGAKGIGGLLGRGAGLLGRGAASLLTNPAVMGTLLAGAAGVWIGKQLNKLIPDEWKEKIGNFIGYMVELPGKMKEGWNALMTDAGKMFGDFWKSAKDKWGEIADWVGKKWGWVKENVIEPAKAVPVAAANAGEKAGAAAGQWLKDKHAAAVDVTSRGMEWVGEKTTAGVQRLKEGLGNAKTSSIDSVQNLIGRGESGKAGYNAYNRGTVGQGKEKIDLSSMTLGEVMQKQSLPKNDPNRLFAVGKYQVIPDTMREAVAHLKLDKSAKFTPAMQEQIYSYLINVKRPAIGRYISGKSDDLQKAVLSASQEWASIANPFTGKSYYDKMAGNSASISSEEFANTLKMARAKASGKESTVTPTGTNYAGVMASKGADAMSGETITPTTPGGTKGSDMMANTPVQLAGGAAGGSLSVSGGGLGSGVPSAPSTSIGVGGATPIAESFDRASASKSTGEGTVLASNKPTRSFAGMSAGGNKTRMDDIPFYIDDMGLLVMNSGYVG